jgi:glucose-6-phosphate dehydrogenase assembly protein OpcA
VTTSARALTGTVVVVGAPDRLKSAADALERIGETVGVRAILISEGDEAAPKIREEGDATMIEGLASRFLNNAVAGLRLSSLPALVWWRGGSIDALDDLANLADRLVLDVDSPGEVWQRADHYFERTALTDLRWTRLTRWRSALAHIFDLPQVSGDETAFESLSIEAADTDAARLFAGWLRSRLRWSRSVAIQITGGAKAGESPLARVRLEGPNIWIALEVKPGSTCLSARVDGIDGSARVVPLGDVSLAALIAEELGLRTRDAAFEEALMAAREIHV